MADNEATIKFILQDEGAGGGDPGDGGAGTTPAAGPIRPAPTTARATAADEKAGAIIADRVPAVAKVKETETASKESATKVKGGSDTELAQKRSGIGAGKLSQIAGAASSAGIPGAGTLAGIAGAAAPIAAVGLAAGAIVAGGIKVITKAEDLVNVIASSRVGRISGEIAAANARARVRKLESDIRTADVLGPTIARNVEASSRLGAASRRLGQTALKPGLDAFARIKAKLAEDFETISGLAETPLGRAAVQSVTDLILDFIGLNMYISTIKEAELKASKSYVWRLAQQQHYQAPDDGDFGQGLGDGGTTGGRRFPGKNAGRIGR